MNYFDINPMPDQVPDELIAALAGVELATIGHWRPWGFCDRGLARLGSGAPVAGTAVTVACPASDNAILHYATGLLRPGDILVVDRLNDRDTACFGEMVMRAAKQSGACAVIIDGPCTDSQAIIESGFPVWCRGVSPRTTNVRGIAGRFNTPVSVGGVVVMPGDAILCDDNGILVLPPHEVAAEAQKAALRRERSRLNMQRLENGEKLAEIGDAARLIEQGKQQ